MGNVLLATEKRIADNMASRNFSQWLLQSARTAFPLRLAALGGVVVIAWAWFQPTWPVINRATAGMVASLSTFLGVDAGATYHPMVWFGRDGHEGFRYIVTDECSAIPLMVTYIIAVLAYPASWQARTWGLAVGIPALMAINVVRLVTVGWVGVYSRPNFNAVHAYGWPVLHVAGAGLLWIMWASRASSPPRGRGHELTAPIRPHILLPLSYTAVLTFIALSTKALTVYGEVISVPVKVIQTISPDGSSAIVGTHSAAFAMYYAQLVALPAFFLAAPVRSARSRGIAAVRLGVPLALLSTIVLQLLMLAGDVGAGTPRGPWPQRLMSYGIFPLVLAVPVGLGLTGCHYWLATRDAKDLRFDHHIRLPEPRGDNEASIQ